MKLSPTRIYITDFTQEEEDEAKNEQDEQSSDQQSQSSEESCSSEAVSSGFRMLSVIRETDEPDDDTYKNLQKCGSSSSRLLLRKDDQMTPTEQFSHAVLSKSNDGGSLLCPNDIMSRKHQNAIV